MHTLSLFLEGTSSAYGQAMICFEDLQKCTFLGTFVYVVNWLCCCTARFVFSTSPFVSVLGAHGLTLLCLMLLKLICAAICIPACAFSEWLLLRVLRSKSANYTEVPMVPEVTSSQERPSPVRTNPVRPPPLPGLVLQCGPLLTDSYFDVRQAMQASPTAFDQSTAPWMLPQPSSPGMFLPPDSPLPVVFVQPIIATSPVPFLPQRSSGGFVHFDSGLSEGRQVPTTTLLSGANTVSTSTPSTSSTATFTSSAEWLTNVGSHSEEPPLQGLPFLSRRESTAMQAILSDSAGSSHRERRSAVLSLALPSPSDLVQQSEPAVTSPACPSTPILSQCPLTSSSISYLFGNNTSGVAALGKRASDSRSPVAGALLQPPAQRPRTIVLNGRKLVIW